MGLPATSQTALRPSPTLSPSTSPSPETLSYFSNIPWTATYLQSDLYTPIRTASRVLKPTGEDAFFATTINTPTTIPHCLSMHSRKIESPPQLGSTYNRTTAATPFSSPVPSTPEGIWLLSLALPGVNGHPATAHGGLLTAILDEIMGEVVILHQNTLSSKPRVPTYTARLETQYRAPLGLPGEVLARAWVTKRQGRKWWVRGQLLDKDGTLTTEAEGLFVEMREVKM